MPKSVPPLWTSRPRPLSLAVARPWGGLSDSSLASGKGGFCSETPRGLRSSQCDLCEGAEFNDLRVGDAVTFDLTEDPVSGARAVRVARRVQ